MNFSTPILLLIFNRPDTTQVVFEKIRHIKPKYLFIAADGARKDKEGEFELCKQTRDIVINNIDWDCKVHTFFRDQNFGCGKAVSSAISWFFEQVEYGIILEDDTVPDSTFFTFCEEMLIKYKDDTRIMTICGSNHIGEWNKGSYSYFFSKYGPIWGWATWKRFWDMYDYDISSWPKFKDENKHFAFGDSEIEVKWREQLFDDMYEKKIDTWDFQLVYSKLSQSGLSIVPKHNLIQNIGFGVNATHTVEKDHRSEIQVQPLTFPLNHNPFVIRDIEADNEYFRKNIYSPEPSEIPIGILRRIWNKLTRTINFK